MFLHPKKGLLTPAGKKYKALGNKSVEVFADSKGMLHELDGTEAPYEEVKKKAESREMNSESQEEIESLQKLEEADKEEMELEAAMREDAKKQAHKEEMMQMHTEVLETVKEASQDITKAVKAIPETPDHLEEQRKWKEEILEALKIEIPEFDDQRIIEAIGKIKFPEVKIPEPKDYTQLLEEIKKALPENTDLSGVIEAIQSIPQFQIPENLISDNRVKVEVDRIAMPNGGAANLDTSLLATEETLQAVLAASGGSLAYDTVDVDTTDPTAIVITKKNGATVIDTKTINII